MPGNAGGGHAADGEMSTHGHGPVDRRTTERLLDTAAAGRPVGPDPLVRLIRAATLPGGGRELAGEDLAVAAFRDARHTAVTARRRGSLRASLAKLVSVKIAALAGALAVGGVALAAGTGALPDLPYIGPASHTPAVHSTTTNEPGGDGARSHGSPSPSLVGLCHAWLAGVADNPGKAPQNPAFGQLLTAAGGRDQVQRYCDDLLASAAPDKDKGGPDGKPSGTPGGRPTETPGADSSRHPGREPSKRPDKAPTPSPTAP